MCVAPSVRLVGVGPAYHFLAQEVKLPDTDAAMVPTSPREPSACPQGPAAQGEQANDTHRYGRIIEGRASDRIEGRQAKDDGDEADPQACDERDRFGSTTELEGAAFEVVRVVESHGDGDAIRDVQTDRGD